ncbi:mechanosensitive ion channel family protein, partial [Bacteroidota bacterium]
MKTEFFHYILLIAVTLIVASVTTLILRKILNTVIRKLTTKLKTDPTNYSFIKNSLSILIYASAIIFIFFNIPYLKSLGTALFAGAGVIAAIIGFASQKAFSNIISGIFILVFKPFRVGDILESANTQKGIVEEITLWHTVIRNYEHRRIIIPNSTISEETIINSDMIDGKIRKFVDFGISYDSDVDKAIEIIQDEALNHNLSIDNRSKNEIDNNDHSVLVRVISLSDFSVNLRAYVWAENNDKAFTLQCDLLKSVKKRFDKEGIEIPFPYRTIGYGKRKPIATNDT